MMQTEISLKDILGIARKYLAFLLALTVLAAAIGFSVTQFFIAPKYTSSATMYVSAKEGGSQNSSELTYAKSLVKTYETIITSHTVLQKVVDELHTDYPDLTVSAIRDMLSIASIDDTEAFTISVTSADPQMATDICNVVAEVAPPEVLRVVKASAVELIDPARVPTEASHPVLRNTVIAALIVFILAYAVLFLREMLDTKVYSRNELTANFQVPVLGVIPDSNGGGKKRKTNNHSTIQEDRERLLTSKTPFNVAEAYRMMRTNIVYLPIDGKCKKIAVTSSNAAEGKTTTATNLSLTLAKNGARVLLIDADMRKPRIRKLLGIKDPIGLSEYIAGLTEQVPVQASPFRNLSVMVSGKSSANAAELLASRRLSEMIALLEDQFDYMIFDLPPINVVTDAGVISKLVDGYILVTYSQYSDVVSVRDAVNTLSQLEAKILGFVLNGLNPKGFGKYGKYGKYGKNGRYGKYYSGGDGYESVNQRQHPKKSVTTSGAPACPSATHARESGESKAQREKSEK